MIKHANKFLAVLRVSVRTNLAVVLGREPTMEEVEHLARNAVTALLYADEEPPPPSRAAEKPTLKIRGARRGGGV